MAFNLGQRIRVSSKHADIDERKGPFNSITEALNANSPTSREKGRTVYIIENGKVVEYWFEAGTADSDLVKKTQGGSGDLTPVFITATMIDIGASESETQDDIDQKLATWIESQRFVIPQGEIWFFELLREGSDDGDGGSSNITLEEARQNGNVLEGNIIGEEEFNKQGNRKAFAQLSDVYDQFKNQDNIPRLIVDVSLQDLGMTSQDSMDDVKQALATYIENEQPTVDDTTIPFYRVSGFEDTISGGNSIPLTGTEEDKPVTGIITGSEEFDKQNNRKAFAQLSGVYDQFKNLPNASGISSYNKMLVANSDGVVGERDNLQSDKSSDATFNAFKVRNSNGDEAYVDNAYNALKQSLTNMTTTQALELAQLLNGGAGSGGQMSVNVISPPILQNQYDSIEYVLLRGVNLNLNVNAMSIEILASDKSTVVATIPNNQIQLNSDGLSLVFYYNFHNFPMGTYFIKLVGGSKTYITTLDLKIVESVENINTSSITWEKLYDSTITPDASDVAIGSNFTATVPPGDTTIPTISFKSSEIFAQGEDFYLEVKLTFGASFVGGGRGDRMSYFGLGYSNTQNILLPVSLVYMNYRGAGSNYMQTYNNSSTESDGGQLPLSVTVTFIKTGNLFRTIIGSTQHSITLSNNSGYSLFLQLVGRVTEHTIQGQIIKAFKFN